MHHRNHAEQHVETLQLHAARLAFPDWTPGPDDWTSLYTRATLDGPVTEVAVYRDRARIHYTRIAGDELHRFWTRLMSAHADT